MASVIRVHYVVVVSFGLRCFVYGISQALDVFEHLQLQPKCFSIINPIIAQPVMHGRSECFLRGGGQPGWKSTFFAVLSAPSLDLRLAL